MKNKLAKLIVGVILALSSICSAPVAVAQGTVFTYQGKLSDAGSPANTNYDFQFKLFDTATVGTGTQFGAMVPVSNVPVTNGVFTVPLDFGACATCFNGANRFLEITVKQTSGSTFTTLGPRQQITSAPYAIKSQNAAAADGLSVACVSCVTSSQIGSVNGSAVTGTIPVASVPAGSASYVQNQNAGTQALSNFMISGNGTAGGTLFGNIVSAITQYNIGATRVLAAPFGSDNLFTGLNAGISNTGSGNSFFGNSSGFFNSTGNANSFFGSNGQNNTTGSFNSVFGNSAGVVNTVGERNSFFGSFSGNQSQGSFNSFFGQDAGKTIQAGSFNSFFGQVTGAGATTANSVTLLGQNANVANNLSNATGIGANAQVAQSNSLVLGSINGVNDAAADTNVGIGTTSPGAPLHVQRDGNASNNWQTAQVRIGGATDTRKQLNLGYDTTNNLGVIQAGWATVAFKDLLINPFGGNVGIGTTTPADRLDVAGDIRVGTGSNGCVKDADGTVIAGACSSDARFKRDVTPFPKILDQLVKLQPVNFYWRTTEYPEKAFGESRSFGLVAQEVERVLPELVTDDEMGFKVVRYNKLPLLLLQGIKELKTHNDFLRRENDALKRRLEEQEARLRRLEAKLGQ